MDEQRPEPPANEGDAALRELVTRLLALPDIYEQVVEPPRIHVGRLPEILPVEIPIPEGLTIVGGMTRDMSRRNGRMLQIVLDTNVPAERFRETYRQLLLASGWNEDQELPRQRGFVLRSSPMLFRAAQWFPRLRRRLGLDRAEVSTLFHARFRLGARGPRLAVYARDRRDAPTDVHLILFTGGRRGPRPGRDPAWTAIPRLYSLPSVHERPDVEGIGVLAPPFGARQLRGNWGGGGSHRENDGAYSYVALEIDLDITAIAAHYTAQLEEAGWSRTDEGQSGPQAWSTWTFADRKGRPWTGAFTALRLPEAPDGASNRYLLQVHAGRMPNH